MAQEEISSLIQTIDAAPDPLHGDLTPSVLKLIDRGLDGAVAVLPVLNAPKEATRGRAYRVIQGVVARLYGFREGAGFRDSSAEQTWRRVLDDNGYRVDAGEQERIASMAKWAEWLSRRERAE